MDDKVIVWYDGSPMMLHSQVAQKFNLSRGQQIQDSNLYEQIATENINVNRSITGLRPAEDGEICESCSG